MKSENHLARPKTAHFQADTGGEATQKGYKKGYTDLRGYRRAYMLLDQELRVSNIIGRFKGLAG